MEKLLPSFDSFKDYIPLFQQREVWIPAIRAICARHHLSDQNLTQPALGSSIVFQVEADVYIKLFPPLFAHDYEVETAALEQIAPGIIPEAPRILFSGTLEGWDYLVLSRLNGQPLDELWPSLEEAEKKQVVFSLGEAIARLHTLTPGKLETANEPWEQFLEKQLASLIERNRTAGVGEALLAEIAEYFAQIPAGAWTTTPPVFVHGDINPEHVFCVKDERGWRVSGFIDFGDALVADPAYDFVCIGWFLAEQPDLARIFLDGYGITQQARTVSLAQKLTATVLLHRFYDASLFAERFPANPPQSMRDFERRLWPFGPGV